MTLVMAHRGASRAEPENTIAAFRAAVALGADLVELDVRLTSDGELAVVHDTHLADGRAVHEVAARDLPTEVPLLADAFDACRPLMVNVEVKNGPREPGFDPANRAADVLVDQVGVWDEQARVIVSSFHLPAIDRVRALAPDIATAHLVRRVPSLAKLAALVDAGHAGLHPWHQLLNRRQVARALAAGLAVRPWTVDDPERIRTLAAWGVDAVCTNVPDVAVVALRASPA